MFFKLHIIQKLFATLCLVAFLSANAFAQEDHDHDHEGHQHGRLHAHENEISIATGVVPLPAEDELTVGFHLHYIKGLGKTNRFGMGIGFESILDEHKHYTASVVFQYRIYKGWSVSYAPGVLLLIDEHGNETQFAQHIETTYEFELGKFHIGPVGEVGIEQYGVHYMLGVHFGTEF